MLTGAILGHLLALIALPADRLSPPMAIALAVACSLLAIGALGNGEVSDPRTRRLVDVLRVAFGVVAAIILAGVLPGTPEWVIFGAIVGAVALDAVSAAVKPQPRPMDSSHRSRMLAPRVAAIALLAEGALAQWGDAGNHELNGWRATIYLACILAARIAALQSLALVAMRLRSRSAVLGLFLWLAAWTVITADLLALATWLLGGSFPMGPHQLRRLDPSIVQVIAILGGCLMGAAIAAATLPRRPKIATTILVAVYAVSGILIAIVERSLDRTTELADIASLRSTRDILAIVASGAFAAVLWLYQRSMASSLLPRATVHAAATTPSSLGAPDV